MLPLVVLMIAGAGLSLCAGDSAAPRGIHDGRARLPRTARRRPAGADPPDGVLLLDRFWRHARRVFNTLARAAPVQSDHRVSARARARAGRSPRPTRPAAGASWSLNDFVVPIGVGALSAGLIVWLQPGRDSSQLFVAGLGLPAFVAFTQARAPMRFAASVATMLVAGSMAANAQGQALYVSRTFFGVYRVTTDDGHLMHSLFHGTTLHGMQAVDPARQSEPLTYYHREGPIGQAFAGAAGDRGAARHRGRGAWRRLARQLTGRPDSSGRSTRSIPRSSGSLAPTRTSPTSSVWRRLPCRPGRRAVVAGASAAAGYGLIVLDAFSSDAIPVHLMTTEALGLYLSRLAPGGALAFHISNRHLDLAPVLARLALNHGLAVRLQRHGAIASRPGNSRPIGW